MAAVDELSQLKRLILGQEQQSLERLQERVERTGTRAQDVAEVLAESFELNQNDTERLSSAMRTPVRQCISDTVREDPQEFADALFPIIGPAIRRAVSESISALSEKINRALERSFSVQGIKWRIESARTGVPVSQIILRDTFIYRVEQAFVIQRDSGLLIAHVSRDGIEDQDSDAVSAMLTALQDFVHDSFSGEEGSELDTIRVGEQVVWVFHGPGFITAALIAGQPPREMRSVFQEVTESIHQEFGDSLKVFDGSESAGAPLIGGVRLRLQPLIESEIQRSSQQDSSTKSLRPLIVVSCILIAIIATWLIYRFVENARLEELVAKIAATPGVELINITPGKPVAIRAFRDPLAANLSEILNETAFSSENIRAEFVPFQSLESTIVVKRLVTLFSPPESVSMTVENGTLLVSGYAPPGYENRLTGFPLTVFGIDKIDTSQLNAADPDVVDRFRDEIDAPDSVVLSLHDGTAIASGAATYAWLLAARAHQSKIPGINNIELNDVVADPLSVVSYLTSETNASELVKLQLTGRRLVLEGGGTLAWREKLMLAAKQTGLIDSVDSSGFVPVEVEEIEALAAHISSQKFYFSRNDQPSESTLVQMRRLQPDLARLVEIGSMTNIALSFNVRAFADAAGSAEQHEAVRVKRTARMQEYLRNSGVPPTQIRLISGQAEIATDESQQWRRAEIEVDVSDIEN